MRAIILKHLQKMEFVCGLKQFKEYTKEEALELLDCLESLFRGYSWANDDRVDIILHSGMRGEYGDFYHVNEKTVNGWIQQFYKYHQGQIVREVIKNNSGKEQEISDEEKSKWIEIGKEIFREKFRYAKDTGYVAHLSEWGAYWFDKMTDKGLLKPWEYPVEDIEDSVRKELRLAGKWIEEQTVAGRTRNQLWRLFILDCIKEKIQLDKLI